MKKQIDIIHEIEESLGFPLQQRPFQTIQEKCFIPGANIQSGIQTFLANIALIALFVPFVLLTGAIVLFTQLKIGIKWFIVMSVVLILIYPAIWTYAVSPHIISEKGALQSFDKILSRLNIFEYLIKKLPKADV